MLNLTFSRRWAEIAKMGHMLSDDQLLTEKWQILAIAGPFLAAAKTRAQHPSYVDAKCLAKNPSRIDFVIY
jgi:hypothetical protein